MTRSAAWITLALLVACAWLACCATGGVLLLEYRPEPPWHFTDAKRVQHLYPWIVVPHRWSGAIVPVLVGAACVVARRRRRALAVLAVVAACAGTCWWTARTLAPWLPPEPEPTRGEVLRACIVHAAAAPLVLTAVLVAAGLSAARSRREAFEDPLVDTGPLQPRRTPPQGGE